MYVKYKNYTHDDNLTSVQFGKEIIRTERDEPKFERRTATVRGTLKPSSATQANIKTKIDALESAYLGSVTGGDFGLYHDDNSKSSHFWSHNDSYTGVKVKRLSWDDATGSEYATRRSYTIELEADYVIQGASNLVSYVESVSITGTGGPRRIGIELIDGPPVIQTVTSGTLVRARQTGQTVGFLSYPNIAVQPMWPQFEDEWAREYTTQSPEWNGRQWVNWQASWGFQFTSPVPLFGTPRRL